MAQTVRIKFLQSDSWKWSALHVEPVHRGHESHVSLSDESMCTHSECLLRLVHGYAVHADLDGVPCRSISRTVTEVQLYRLNCVDGGSETPKRQNIFKLNKVFFFMHLHSKFACVRRLTDPACQTAGWPHLDWRSQLSARTGSGTWRWGKSRLSRTDKMGPSVCKTPNATVSGNFYFQSTPKHDLLFYFSNKQNSQVAMSAGSRRIVVHARSATQPAEERRRSPCCWKPFIKEHSHCEEVSLHNAEYLYYT